MFITENPPVYFIQISISRKRYSYFLTKNIITKLVDYDYHEDFSDLYRVVSIIFANGPEQ